MSQPNQPPPPHVPAGWQPEWSPDHQAWYFINIETKQSVWQVPTYPTQYGPPAGNQYPPQNEQQQLYPQSGQPFDPYIAGAQGQDPNAASGSASQYFGTQEVIPSATPGQVNVSAPLAHVVSAPAAIGQPSTESGSVEPAEGERGFFSRLTGKRPSNGAAAQNNQQQGGVGWGKVAVGAGAGMLLGGVLKHEWDEHGSFSFSGPDLGFQAPKMDFLGGMFGGKHHHHQQHHHQHHQQQHHSGMAGSLLGALTGGTAAAGAGGAFSGSGLQSIPHHSMGGTGTLNIICANYGGGDVTNKVRAAVTPTGHLDLNDDGDPNVYDRKWGDHWPGNPKSLLILYQYSGRAPELLITWQASGIRGLSPADPPRHNRRIYLTDCGPVIAVIWGIMENRTTPCAPHIIQNIASGMTFRAENDYFEFNGWQGTSKTAVIFWRSPTGIACTSVRQHNMGKLDI